MFYIHLGLFSLIRLSAAKVSKIFSSHKLYIRNLQVVKVI